MLDFSGQGDGTSLSSDEIERKLFEAMQVKTCSCMFDQYLQVHVLQSLMLVLAGYVLLLLTSNKQTIINAI